jgi:hypothetical protein
MAMTWLLLIQVVIISTCSEGFRFCPPAKPPVVSQQVMKTEEACRARAQHYRRYVPERRELVRSQHMTMEQVTTVQCIPQAKS